MKVNNLIQAASEAEDREEYAIAVWHIEDVLEQAERMGVELSREEAVEVIRNVDRKHNAEVGINWDVLGCWIDTTVAERGVR